MSRKRLVLNNVSVYGEKQAQGQHHQKSEVHAGYTRNRLDSVTCTIEAGKLTLLMGSNGSGKSTLLDVLGGLIHPDEGTVVSDTGSPAGMVFQFPEQQLFARTVQGEFDYSLRPLRYSKQAAAEHTRVALQEVGLSGEALALHPFTLSGGQQRRIAIATTLAAAPSWLLLDEASAGLDAEGIRRFAQQLRRWAREEGRGIVLATHDLATFLPLADEVLILVQGRLAAAMSREQLAAAPAVLQQAGLALPDSMRAAVWLQSRLGATEVLPGDAGAGEALSPARFAAAVSRALRSREAHQGGGAAHAESELAAAAALPLGAAAAAGVEPALAAGPANPPPFVSAAPAKPAADALADPVPAKPTADAQYDPVSVKPTADALAAPVSAEPTAALDALVAARPIAATPAEPAKLSQAAVVASPAERPAKLDPRAVWLFCTVVSLGILLQQSVLGLLVSAIITAASIAWSTVAFKTIWRAVLPFVWLTSFTVLLSGIQFIGFSVAEAAETMRAMLRFLFMMAIGFLLPLQYSPLALKKSLEQSLSRLARWKVPVEALALYVSMLMRFVPLIRGEWLRFARIAQARGRRKSKPGTVHIRDLPAIAIPMLLSLLRMAELTASAMEMRGYREATTHAQHQPSLPPLTRRDYSHMLLGVVFFLLLLTIRIIQLG